MAVNMFVSVLGGLAGNLALTLLATGGVFIAGGIAPRIVPLLQQGPSANPSRPRAACSPWWRGSPPFWS